MEASLTLDMSPAEWRQVLLADPCAYCGASSEHVDHIHPRCRVVDNTPENLTGACQACNNSKGGKTLFGFIGRLPVHTKYDRPYEPPREKPAPVQTERDKLRAQVEMFYNWGLRHQRQLRQAQQRIRDLEAELAEHRQAA